VDGCGNASRLAMMYNSRDVALVRYKAAFEFSVEM
jgi:hypothetical protein